MKSLRYNKPVGGVRTIGRSGEIVEVIERCQGLAGEIQLQRRGEDYEIIYNGVFLMATYNGVSEKAAVKRALSLLSEHFTGKPIEVLIGGLGVGYSLQEALACPTVGSVTVVEIEPVVTRWNRDTLSSFNNGALFDPRVSILQEDLLDYIRISAQKTGVGSQEFFHMVMVDTDNGSSWLSLPSNKALYEDVGLRSIHRVLYPSGIACFWAATREDEFERRLRGIFNQVKLHRCREITGHESFYYIAEK